MKKITLLLISLLCLHSCDKKTAETNMNTKQLRHVVLFKFKKEASEKESIAASNTEYKSIRNKKLYKTSQEFKPKLASIVKARPKPQRKRPRSN